MGAPTAIAYCAKCGNTILVGKTGDAICQPIKVPPCRHCRREATSEGFRAGRVSAIAELFIEKKAND